MTVKVGMVGARCRAFIEGFKAHPGAELAAFCDIDEAAASGASQEHGIAKAYRVYEDMLESDIDAVVIGTPMQYHAPMALQALQAGKHVLSEVTAAVNLDELEWLCLEVTKAGKVYMMAENYCFMPENQLVLSLVRKGYFGDVYFGEGEYIHELKGLHHVANGRTTWREWWQMGRSGNTYPTHSLGPVMQWFGDDHIKTVSCFSPGRRTAPEHIQEDTTLTLCQMESGKLIKLRLDMLSNRPHNMTYYSLQGTKGVYEAARGFGDGPKIWLQDFSDEPAGQFTWRSLWDFSDHLPQRYRDSKEQGAQAGHGGGDFFQVFDFVDAIEAGTRPAIDVYTAAEWTAVAFLSAESLARGGAPVPMPNYRAGAGRP